MLIAKVEINFLFATFLCHFFLSQHKTKKTLSIRERIFLLLGSVITLIMVLHKWGIISARALLKIIEGGEAADGRAAFVSKR